ncbi:hypothetical protein CERZMDRAFT_89476 [Cercospora zeae-maydis SCOH1-5]|uniref:Major facilitator superfamily (MFS) profile domain-containing protein n=1 Tax=Cercospora zeae-maydis SCOH1-5 TaxID=717836 RepID=A0A6A6EYH5_9PEZI|nr:hypothetical protein CERZMDRAFT_89476 [Cercospora zeae-maydis SCOH1-5]
MFDWQKHAHSRATTPQRDGAASLIGTEKTSTDKAHHGDLEKGGVVADRETIRLLRPYTFALAAIVSIGIFTFGYDTGQINGFLEMPNFLRRFGNVGDSPSTYAFTDAVSGTIVGLLSIGTTFGALCSAPVADKFGRKVCIIFWNIMFCVGVIVQMTAEYKWYQVALARWVAAMVGCCQLFITLGIFVAYCINFGTEKNPDASAWRIPMGVGFIPPALMIIGILFLPESPRWDYRNNNIERARKTIARSYGVTINHWEVQCEMRDIKEKHDAEFAGGGGPKWYEIFTGPRMAYRTLLGVTMQALQQLTGANFSENCIPRATEPRAWESLARVIGTSHVLFPAQHYCAPKLIASFREHGAWNFLISFFSPFVTSAIDFQYGYIFASCCFISILIVYFFLEEHQGRALEEIDTMYITHVSPRKRSQWQPRRREDSVTADALYLEPGARGIKKADAAGMEGEEKKEDL